MNPILRNILAVIAGIIVGGIVNVTLVNLGPSIIPLPEGTDVSNMEALAKSMPMFSPANFIFPFLGHALGALSGAFVAAILAASHKMKFALGISIFTMLGGVTAVIFLPGPLWFEAVDLIFAYIPMGYLGGVLAGARNAE